MSEDNKLPQPEDLDHAFTAAKAILSVLPFGGPLVELFGAYLTPTYVRRRDWWLQTIADDVATLCAKVEGLSPESLFKNEAFYSGFFQASRIALQTHRKEKLEALRNALLNMAIATHPDEDQQAMFLAHIETLTPSHIRVLRFYRNPREETYPEFRIRTAFVKRLAHDLEARGLVNFKRARDNFTPLSPVTVTELGAQFLAFIQAPPNLQRRPSESP